MVAVGTCGAAPTPDVPIPIKTMLAAPAAMPTPDERIPSIGSQELSS